MLRTTLLLGALTGLIMGIGQWLGGSNGLTLAFIFAMIIQMAISRTWEYAADATGARTSGDPLSLASALGKLSGEGDAQATAIYAQAFGQDPEFYAFTRRLQAYEKILSSGTTLVLPPDSELLRHLQNPGGQ